MAAPWDNVQLAPPPSAPSYNAPNIGIQLGALLGNLPADFQAAQQAARQRQLQQMFADPNSPASQALARAGIDRSSLPGQLIAATGAEGAMPLAQRQISGQVYSQIMGGSGAGGDIYGAILGQESGNRDNVGDSSAGAIGPGQILPSTFNQYARPGEDIRNPDTNRAVSRRILDDYMNRYGGDASRAAVAYYSGPGNVAPPSSPTPWIENKQPKGGPSVAQYVAQVQSRMGGQQQTPADIGQMDPRRMSPEFADRLEAGADQLRKSAGALSASGFPEGAGKAQQDRADKLSAQAAEIRKFLADREQQKFGVGIKGEEAAVSEVGKAQGGRMGEDIPAGGPPARRTLNILNTMDDAITRAGPNLTTGPGAEYMLKLKQAAQNWLPGLDFKGLPEAEVVTKLNAQLAAQAAKAMTARPSQLEFRAFMQNNPGLQNSVAGTKYLIDVLRQATTQDIQLGQLASRVQDPRSWPQVEDRFYQQNPIKSPFSGKPLSGDERVQGAPQPSATNKTAPAPGKYRWTPDGGLQPQGG